MQVMPNRGAQRDLHETVDDFVVILNVMSGRKWDTSKHRLSLGYLRSSHI